MMNLRKLFLATLLLPVMTVAFAETTGTVNYTGQVVDSTCSISLDDVNKTVTLPTVPSSALSGAGISTGWTAFELKFEDCGAGKVYAHFNPISNAANIDGDGILNTGDADNIQLILGTVAGPIRLSESDAGDAAAVDVGDDNIATMNYVVGYLRTNEAAVVPGTVIGKLVYDIIYK